VRWRLGGEWHPEGPRPGAAPVLDLYYVKSPHPELVLRTDVHDPWATAQQVLFLVQRLHRAMTLSIESP
jgi:hypothetical protein